MLLLLSMTIIIVILTILWPRPWSAKMSLFLINSDAEQEQ